MDPEGIYLMDDGMCLRMFIAREAKDKDITSIFGHTEIYRCGIGDLAVLI